MLPRPPDSAWECVYTTSIDTTLVARGMSHVWGGEGGNVGRCHTIVDTKQHPCTRFMGDTL